MSVVEAVARCWVGEPPGDEWEAVQTGEPLTKENVEWTRDPTLPELLEDAEDLSAKAYRFIPYSVREIRRRRAQHPEDGRTVRVRWPEHRGRHHPGRLADDAP